MLKRYRLFSLRFRSPAWSIAMQPNENTNQTKSNGSVTGPATAQSEAEAANGRSELNELLYALQAVRVGDFSVRMASDHVGIVGKIADTFNEIVAANQRMAQE